MFLFECFTIITGCKMHLWWWMFWVMRFVIENWESSVVQELSTIWWSSHRLHAWYVGFKSLFRTQVGWSLRFGKIIFWAWLITNDRLSFSELSHFYHWCIAFQKLFSLWDFLYYFLFSAIMGIFLGFLCKVEISKNLKLKVKVPLLKLS